MKAKDGSPAPNITGEIGHQTGPSCKGPNAPSLSPFSLPLGLNFPLRSPPSLQSVLGQGASTDYLSWSNALWLFQETYNDTVPPLAGFTAGILPGRQVLPLD